MSDAPVRLDRGAGPPKEPPGDRGGPAPTYLITLRAKALDFRSPRSILHDAKASQLFDVLSAGLPEMRSGSRVPALVVRARALDEWLRAGLRDHPNAIVLNVGCGLDARVERIRPPPSAEWWDVDLPEVIELRRRFFSDAPGYRMLGASITDPGWWGSLPRNRPGLVVADGVLAYLTEAEVTTFLQRVVSAFAHGQAMFDVMDSRVQARANEELKRRLNASIQWTVDDPTVLDRIDPRLRRVETTSLFRSRYFPWPYRLAFALALFSPRLRNAIRLVRCEF